MEENFLAGGSTGRIGEQKTERWHKLQTERGGQREREQHKGHRAWVVLGNHRESFEDYVARHTVKSAKVENKKIPPKHI